MPQAVATWIATNTLTAASVLTASQITAITYAAFAVGSVVVGNHQRRKAQRQARAAFNAQLEDRLVMVSTANGQRSRCYGRVRNVDGVLFKATRGTNSEFYTLFIAVAGHEIDAFETVYFGDTAVTLDGSGYVTTPPYAITRRTSEDATVTLNGSGGATVNATGTVVAGSASAVTLSENATTLSVSVSGSTITVSGGTAGAAVAVNWQQSRVDSKARVRFYTGGSGQNLSTVLKPLFPSLITDDHRFAGIAGMLVDLEFDPDAFPSGVPSISAVFRGARVLDPRTSTTAWTRNPALIARDWALYANGGGCAAGDLAAASFTAAANACDVSQNFVTDSGTTTAPLFTCDIVARTDEDPSSTFEEIVESMAGKAGWAGGQLRVVAGAYRAPVATITDDWLSGVDDIQIVPEPPAEEAVNVYRPTISDKDQGWLAVPAPEVRSTTYITADGRELPREITLGGVTDVLHAQHVCGVLMRDARNALTVRLPCNLRAFQLELFDVVNVTLARFGWSAKTFEVVDWAVSLTGGVVLTLKETAAAIYNVDSSFAELDLTPNTELPDPSVVTAPTGLTVTTSAAELVDGQPVVRALVEWTPPADASVSQNGWIEVEYLEIGSNFGWQSVRASGTQSEVVLPALQAGSAYLFRTRSVNALGVHSDWTTQTTIVTSAAPKIQSTGIAPGAVSALVQSEKAVTLTAFASGIEPVTVVAGSTLPTTKSTETIVLTGTGKLYRWTGSAYTAAVPTSDLSGTISQAQIADAAISVAKFASGLEPVTIVSSVPGSLSTRSVFNTTDGKLYRWNGSAYVATVPTTDLTGTVADAQIAGLAASKVTGQLLDSQLAAIAAAKVTGTLTASQLAVSIGGGNLLPNANFKKHASGLPYAWAEYNNGATARTFAVSTGGLFGANFVRVTADAATTNTLGVFTSTGVTGGGVTTWVPGQTYVISFWARASSASAAGFKMTGLPSNMGFSPVTTLSYPDLINGTWQRYAWRVSPASNAQTPNGELYISWEGGSGTLPSGAAFDICAVQVELGDMPTAFSPRPSEILPDTITATEVADNAITSPKIIAGAVVAGKIAAGAVSATEIAAGSVTTAKLAAGAVTANEIAAGAIVADKIASNAVTAGKIEAGAVTTAKLAAGAVTANEIAAATITGGKIAAGTITGSNIAADTITAGQIAAGAITADEVAANAVRAQHLLVTGPGSLLPDGTFEDQANWAVTYGGTLALFKTVTDAPAGRYVAYVPASTQGRSLQWHPGASGLKAIPIDRTKRYRFSFWYRVVSTSGAHCYATLQQRDSTGALIGNNGGHEFYVWILGATAAGSWTQIEVMVGQGSSYEFSASCRFVAPSFLFNWENAGGEVQIADVRLMPAVDATLIVDGAIIASKVAAGAITTAKLDASAVTADKIAANAITTAKLAAGAIGADQIAANAITTANLLVVAGNLVANPDFATGDTKNWRPWVGTQSVVAKNASGVPASAPANYVMRFEAGTVSTFAAVKAYSDAGADKDGFAVEAGASYLVSVAAVKDAATTVNIFYVIAYFWKADGTYTDLLYPIASNLTTSWATYEASFTAPTGALRCWLYVYADTSGGPIWWTKLYAARRSSANLIVDGAITTDKLAASSVTAGKISVTNLQAVNASTGALTVDGALTVGTGGKVQSGKTSYGSGTGWLIEHNAGTPRLDIGSSTQYVRWTGSALEIGGQVVTNANLAGSISADKLSLGTITVSFSPSSVTQEVFSSAKTSYTSVTASASGGTSPYTYRFTIGRQDVDFGSGTRPYASILSITSGDTVNVEGAQPNNSGQTFDIVCVATDANGRTGTGICTYDITYGTRP